MIKAFDHVAIPIRRVDEMLEFYRRLGCSITDDFGQRLYSVHFGNHKINFHTPEIWDSGKFSLRAHSSVPGCGDFCFVWGASQDDLLDKLEDLSLAIEEGPVERLGGRELGTARGSSVYIRDPDDNLLEFIVYPEA